MRIIANPGLNYSLPYISIVIIDRITNEPLLNIRAAMIESLQQNISSKGLMTFNLNGVGFVGLNGSNVIDPNYTGTPPTILQK